MDAVISFIKRRPIEQLIGENGCLFYVRFSLVCFYNSCFPRFLWLQSYARTPLL